MTSGLHALVATTDLDSQELISTVLSEQKCTVQLASTGDEAMDHLQQGADFVIIDELLPDGDGIEVMQRLRHLDPFCPMMMIAHGRDVRHAVLALQLGAADYATKPIGREAIDRFLRGANGRCSARAQLSGLGALLGTSMAMRRVRAVLRRAVDNPTTPVLLIGEMGTGKALAARALSHEDPNTRRAFLTLECANRKPAVLEAESVGNQPEGFSRLLECAAGGTLYMRDIDHLSPGSQGRLLTALECIEPSQLNAHTNVPRIIASSTSDLRQAARERTFRAELYHRLSAFVVDMPPLRARAQDIELLATHFLNEISRRERKSPPLPTPETNATLRSHTWPGNVRELRNVIERAVLLHDKGRLHARSFELSATPFTPFARHLVLPPAGLDLRELERRMVEQALRRAEGNLARAARLLGLNRDQMRYRVAKYGLER